MGRVIFSIWVCGDANGFATAMVVERCGLGASDQGPPDDYVLHLIVRDTPWMVGNHFEVTKIGVVLL